MNTAQSAAQRSSSGRPEDPELTREILFYCARERLDRPPKITLQELEGAFAWISRYELTHHIERAIELELLDAEDRLARRVGRKDGSTWIDLLNMTLSGLTPKGREYVKRARTPEWRKAVNRLQRSGQEVTTAMLLERFSSASEA